MTGLWGSAGTPVSVWTTGGQRVWGETPPPAPTWRNIAIGPYIGTQIVSSKPGPRSYTLPATLTSDASELRLTYTAIKGNGPITPVASPVTYAATIDGEPVLFGGATSGVCSPGGTITSDPLPGAWRAGQVIEIATTGTGEDVPDSGFGLRPYLVSAVSDQPSVLIIGSSSATPLEMLDGFRDAEVAVVNGGVGGTRQTTFTDVVLRDYLSLAGAGFTHALLQIGANTMGQGASPLMQTSVDLAWRLRELGIPHVTQKVWKPYTTSTDGWTTVEGQEPRFDSRAIAVDWLRRGAPVTADGRTVDLTGATAAPLYVGHTGHPFSEIVDLGALLQDSTDPDAWRVDHGPLTVDGLHMGGTGYDLMAPGVAAWASSLT